MIFYKSIVGSKAYNYDTDTSDTDILCIDANLTADACSHTADANHRHIITLAPNTAIIQLCDSPMYVQSLAMLYPKEFLIENDLSSWILNNRDALIKSMYKTLYHDTVSYADELGCYVSTSYPRFPKRIIYSTHFATMLYNHAQGMPFADAVKAQSDMKEQYMAIRNRSMPVEEVQNLNTQARNNARAVESFYVNNHNFDNSLIKDFQELIHSESLKYKE